MHWMLLPLRRYAQFSGRSRRREYWSFILFQFLVYLAFLILISILSAGAAAIGGDTSGLAAAGGAVFVVSVIYGLFSLALIIPMLAVTVRRLHDINRTGWWILAPILPYALMFVSFGFLMAFPDLVAVGGILAFVAGIGGFVLGITLLVFMFLSGTRGLNRYGPDPKAPLDSEVFA